MNAAAIILAPWRSTRNSSSWIAVAVFASCVFATIALGNFAQLRNEGQWIATSALYGVGAFYIWAFFMPNLLLLAIDGRRLRIPGLEQTAYMSAVFYALLMLSIPCLILLAFGNNPLIALIIIGIAFSTGLAFALLPRYVSMWSGFVPFAFFALKHHINVVLPAAHDPIWLVCGGCALLVLVAICVIRWRILLIAEQMQTGFRGTMLAQYRDGMRGLYGAGSGKAPEQLIRQVPDWLQPQPNFAKVGPQWPANAMRVTLGRMYLPQTMRSHLRQYTQIALILLLVTGVLALVGMDNVRGLWSDVHQLWPLATAWIAIAGMAGLASGPAQCLYRQWRGNSHTLALLALLPMLGDTAGARRQLLRAALGQPLLGQLLILLPITLVAAAYLHVDLSGMVCLVIAGLGCAGINIVLALMILGNRMPSTIGWTLFIIVAIALFSFSVFISFMAARWHLSASIEPWLIAAWLAFGAVLVWLGYRGWIGLRERPHPFLPS